MKKTLIIYKPEYADLAINLRDNYRAHDHEEADIVSVDEHNDIEYAEKMQYDEAVFIEDSDTVTFHDIESGYTNRRPVTDVFYNDLRIKKREDKVMVRKIIHIDEEKCNGCGLCASACHEGAIDIIDGKAKLVRENFCDGLGDCLPGCPTGAITFEEREAPEYDEKAVQEAKERAHRGQETGRIKMNEMKNMQHEGGCPGSKMMQFSNNKSDAASTVGRTSSISRLAQWPCQIKLIPAQAPFFEGAKLLIAADCTAYAYANMHEEFMRGKVTLIGCPKLDAVDYSEKLTAIIRDNDIKSVTVVRMEVPCCGGLQRAAENALKSSGKFIPWQVVTISRDGRILD